MRQQPSDGSIKLVQLAAPHIVQYLALSDNDLQQFHHP